MESTSQPSNQFILEPQSEADFPFKEHSRFPELADILSRKNKHHVQLKMGLSSSAHKYFFQSFITYLEHDHVPKAIRQIKAVYFPSHLLELKAIKKFLGKAGTLFILSEHHYVQLSALVTNPNCRFILVDSNLSPSDFTSVIIERETDDEALLVLQRECKLLEEFHNVLIPDEVIKQAYALANRYLCTKNTLEKACLLLDSVAARSQSIEHSDQSQLKPIVTLTTLHRVLSNWTAIPASQLALHKFKMAEFMMAMQQKIVGQEAAINLLAQELQQAQADIRINTQVFSALICAGPKQTGKRALGVALSEQLFQQTAMLYRAQVAPTSIPSISCLKLQNHATQNYESLKEIINQKPHAIIMLEDVEQMPSTIIDNLYEILSSGFLHDNDGQTYNFKHAIFILTTTLGTQRLQDIAKLNQEVASHDVDLVQLVMNEKPTFTTQAELTPAEIAEQVMQEVSAYLPTALCQHLHPLPFLPLSKTAIENVLRINLRDLGKSLEAKLGIELGYAAEVVRFLTMEVLDKNKTGQPNSLNKALKSIYAAVEQAVLSNTDPNRPRQLLLQLNETGQMLRAAWLTSEAARQHA